MRLSVVIPTLNRAEALRRTLHDHLQQHADNVEVIVVDGSTQANTELESLAQQDPRLIYLHVENRGTCFSRNTGVQKARGEIIVFTDDDVQIDDPNFLQHHLDQYADPTIGGVGGRVRDLNHVLNKEQTGPVCTVTPTGQIFGRADADQQQDINAPRGANMSFRKTVIEQVGGFDEAFRGNAMREETDFSWRVVKAGWRIVFEPSAHLVHVGATSGGSRTENRLQWYRDFFFNESYFFLKHVSRVYLPLFFFRKLRAIVACWLWYGRGRWAWMQAPWQSFAEAWRLTRTTA